MAEHHQKNQDKLGVVKVTVSDFVIASPSLQKSSTA